MSGPLDAPACEVCGASLKDRRVDARSCSGACRAQASRARCAASPRAFWGGVRAIRRRKKRTEAHSWSQGSRSFRHAGIRLVPPTAGGVDAASEGESEVFPPDGFEQLRLPEERLYAGLTSGSATSGEAE